MPRSLGWSIVNPEGNKQNKEAASSDLYKRKCITLFWKDRVNSELSRTFRRHSN